MNLLSESKFKCPLSVLERVRIIEVIKNKRYENFIET